jgi:general secretion pathway protein B
MSLILEALKKSEAKRRLGEAPDIGTPFATPRRRGRALPLLVFVIMAAGALGWWLLRHPTPATTAATNLQKTTATAPPPTARSAPAMPIRPAQNAPAAQQPKASIETQPAAPPMPADTSPWVAVGKPDNTHRGNASGQRKLPSNMRRIEPATPVADKSPPTATAPKIASAPPAAVPAAPSAPALANAAKAPDPKTPDPRAPTASDAAPKAAVPKVAAPTLAAAQPAPSAVAKSDVPFYYELPFNVRKSLPPLRLSMHVYAGDPAQRFVVLNDSRLAEGDKTADDVTLREVRKDGAVLEFQGQRFFYPRDGS